MAEAVVVERKTAVGMLQANCVLLYDAAAKTAVFVDPGDEAARLHALLQECAPDWAHVHFLLTHGHFDHAGGLQELWELTGARGTVYVSALDEALVKTVPVQPAMFGMALRLKAPAMPLSYVVDGQELALSPGLIFTVIHTPGHTPGSVCYWHPARNTLYSGDTLFRLGVGRTDFPGGSEADMKHSVRDKLFAQLPDDTRVVPGHNESTTIAFEKAHNFFIRP